MKCIEMELNDQIYDLCIEKGIPVEIHWRCLGDICVFYKDGQEFAIACVEYYAKDISDIKLLIMEYIEAIWEDEKLWEGIERSGCYKVAICVMDIVDMNGWYNVIMGGAITGCI